MKHTLSLGFAALCTLFTVQARADIAPSCSQFDPLPACVQADVEKACPTTGVCKEISCDAGAKVYKCVVCPTVLADGAAKCTGPSDLGNACGTDGECGVVPSYCTGNKFSCVAKSGGAGGAGGGGGAPAGGSGGTVSAGGSGGTVSAGGSGGAVSGGGSGGAATAGSAGSTAAAPAQAADDSGCSTAAPATTWKLGALGALALGFLVARRRR